MKLFVSPHNDDAVLFGAFTLLREHALVLTVFDSYVQVLRGHAQCTAEVRRAEDVAAMEVLGCSVVFGGVRDNESEYSIGAFVRNVLERWKVKGVEEVWLPAEDVHGHPQHNLVGAIGARVFNDAKIHRYLTYVGAGKAAYGVPVCCTGEMLLKKLRALICYETQIVDEALGCWPHFLRDQAEYLLPE